MIKNLIRDYPEDALEFFNPEIITRYGKPIRVDFHIQETKKLSHFDKNLKHDLAVKYEFAGRKSVLLTLIEHWSDKSHFDIHRFAKYLIDLNYQFPDYEIFPVALFTDKSEKWLKQPQTEIKIGCLDEVYLSFRYRLIRMKAYEAERYRDTKNKFVAVLRSAMKWDIDNKIFLAVDFIKDYMLLEENIKNAIKNVDIIEYFLYISAYEKKVVSELLKKRRDANMSIVQEIIEEGRLEGKLEGQLCAAKKMYEKGFCIEEIIEITELSREELLNAGIIEGYELSVDQCFAVIHARK